VYAAFAARHDGRLYLLTSGDGWLNVVDPVSGRLTPVAELPGVGRGLALHGNYAVVGLSKPRPSLVNVPIVARREQLKCGLAVVDLRMGAVVAELEFVTGVEEIFDVQMLPVSCPYLSGPRGLQDTGQPLWTMPRLELTTIPMRFQSRFRNSLSPYSGH